MAITKSPAYETLTVSSSAALVIKLGLFSGKSTITCQEIGKKDRNRVFRVTDQENNKSMIIKQIVPIAKVYGECMPLVADRTGIESSALIRQALACPHLVPNIYYSDTALAVTVMEDLSHLSILRKGLIVGESFPLLSHHIGEFLGKTLFYNSDYFLDPHVKKELEKQFANPDLCAHTEKFLFTEPFFNTDTKKFEEAVQFVLEDLRQDDILLEEAAKLKRKFVCHTESLIHGDLHTGSILANKHETKIIDPEFASFGPIGFDIGLFIADLFHHAIFFEEERNTLFQHISTLWTVFSSTFKEAFLKDCREPYKTEVNVNELLHQIFADAAGFAGCEMIRRSIGFAQLDVFESAPITKRFQRKSLAIRFGQQLIKKRAHLQHSEDFTPFFKMLT